MTMPAILLVGALVLVPGLGAALAVAPRGGMTIESRIALSFGLGYALVAAVATVLALAHVFHLPTFVAGVVLATAAVWVVAVRRVSPREHAAALRAQAAEAPYALAAGLTLLLVVALTRPFYAPERNLAVRSSWRYWADGLEVAEAGHVPVDAAQWGTVIPTTVSKVVLNAFQGGISFLLGPEPLPAIAGIVAVTAVGLVAALLALGRELGLTLLAPLVPVLVLLVPDGLPWSHEASNDLRLFTAENIGRLGAFSALLVGILAVRGRAGRAPAIVAGVVLALAGLTHLVPVLVAGALLALYALATVILDKSTLRRVLVAGAVVTAAFAVSYVGVLGLSGGDLGLQRATSGEAFDEFPPDVDPTQSFSHGKLVTVQPKQGHFYLAPRELIRRYGEDLVDRTDAAKLAVIALAALAVATAVAVFFVRRFFTLAVVAWGLATTILAVAFLFSFRYGTVIPANFGVRRLYDYAVISPALALPAVLEAAATPLLRRGRAVALAVAAAVAVVAVAAAVSRVPGDQTLSRADAGIAVFERVAEKVPCDARMIANARTAGSWQAWTGRRAVTEGMSPFLRPEVMARILPTLIAANDFFKDPQANQSFLEEEDIQYIVVVEPGVWFGWGGTGRNPGDEDAENMAALDGVEPVYRGDNVSIFAVPANLDAVSGTDPPARCLL
jgi:hypothetical protein